MDKIEANGNGAAMVRRESTAVAAVDPRAAVAPTTLAQVQKLAEVVQSAGLYGVRSAEEAMIRMMTGMELGLSAMQSIRGVYVIETQGVRRPSLAADMMVGICKMRGDVCEYFRLVESTDGHATCETQRRGDPSPVRMSYTIQQASTAGLTGRGTWKAHPAAMLRARASSTLARAVYPDLLNGLYDPDEVDDIGPSRASAVATVVDAKSAHAEASPPKPSDGNVLDDLRARIAAATDDAALAAVAHDIAKRSNGGSLAEADVRALRAEYTAAKARRKAPPPAPIEATHDAEPEYPEPGSDGE